MLSPLPQLLKLGKMSRWVRNSSNPSDKVRRGRVWIQESPDCVVLCCGVGSPCQAVVSITGLYKNILLQPHTIHNGPTSASAKYRRKGKLEQQLVNCALSSKPSTHLLCCSISKYLNSFHLFTFWSRELDLIFPSPSLLTHDTPSLSPLDVT